MLVGNVAELESRIGSEIAVGDWITVAQEQIDLFATATGDHQWIHIDVERAAAESPFGGTIAHGFLSLSLLSKMLGGTVGFSTLPRLTVNYGLNRVRFIAPVRAGTRIRPRIVLQGFEPLSTREYQLTWLITVEREQEEKPALVAEWLIRYYL
ncbi:MAG: MaoC family dehydratase [Acidobacteria bacterium]|nr:MaoC family dehydratase [Acidobacteriota bacterium]